MVSIGMEFLIVISLFSGPTVVQGLESSLETLRNELAGKHLLKGEPITFSPELERVVLLTEQSRAMLGPGSKAPDIPRRQLRVQEVFFYYVVQPLFDRRPVTTSSGKDPWRSWISNGEGDPR